MIALLKITLFKKKDKGFLLWSLKKTKLPFANDGNRDKTDPLPCTILFTRQRPRNSAAEQVPDLVGNVGGYLCGPRPG